MIAEGFSDYTPDHPPERCPCGSGEAYAACCQPYHRGKAAPAPEALMRSRFSAFVLNLPGYVTATWHPSTRPQSLDLTDSPAWASLQVLASDDAVKGSENQGRVHFRAVFRAGPNWGYLEEDSSFIREAGRWYYLSGDTREGMLKPGRNEPCPCGSGRKYKACCL